jgi:hypothetical protein
VLRLLVVAGRGNDRGGRRPRETDGEGKIKSVLVFVFPDMETVLCSSGRRSQDASLQPRVSSFSSNGAVS